MYVKASTLHYLHHHQHHHPSVLGLTESVGGNGWAGVHVFGLDEKERKSRRKRRLFRHKETELLSGRTNGNTFQAPEGPQFENRFL
ncbi:hypothetical protein EYF80_039091 [Liparis tanakae]|uniref:Uncharacterized protein n=1 Tax=Liparis tanakae TaxID=230148 RepID=A0A4Z2GDG1_9TELE|nr:hypothetical protein EYF80_039091 [Liparis tanakae]